MCRPTTPKVVARGVEAMADVEVQADRAVALVVDLVVALVVALVDVEVTVLVAVQVADPADETNTAAKASPAREVSRTIDSRNEVDA